MHYIQCRKPTKQFCQLTLYIILNRKVKTCVEIQFTRHFVLLMQLSIWFVCRATHC